MSQIKCFRCGGEAYTTWYLHDYCWRCMPKVWREEDAQRKREEAIERELERFEIKRRIQEGGFLARLNIYLYGLDGRKMSKSDWFWCLFLSIGGISIMVGIATLLFVLDAIGPTRALVGVFLFMVGWFCFIAGVTWNEVKELKEEGLCQKEIGLIRLQNL